ncbi:hypothetical protein HGRIS_004818 [Hohenbuehelia grisea]|uniref:Uncharacterized protein n=1 Tax=Hohenbuehelia grisea TaxID=104357 RepID=A0ABR3JDP4_9AGAR
MDFQPLPSKLAEFMHMNSPVMDPILDYLSPADIVHYSQTSVGSNEAVNGYIFRAFSLERTLLPFFPSLDQYDSFRDLQERTGVLISGSTALSFFERAPPYTADSDLDLYVEQTYAHDVGSWLLTQTDYKFAPGKYQDASFEKNLNATISPVSAAKLLAVDSLTVYHMRGVCGVFDFKADDGRKIQLIVAKRAPLDIILNFHSSVVMNIIGYEFAYCLFPKATLQQRISMICSTAGPHQQAARDKYTARGWRMIASADELTYTERPCFEDGLRYVGDPDCWAIPLADAARRGFKVDRMHSNCALITYDNAGIKVSFDVVECSALRHNFTLEPSMWKTYKDILVHAARFVDHERQELGLYDDEISEMFVTAHRFNHKYDQLLKFYSCGVAPSPWYSSP